MRKIVFLVSGRGGNLIFIHEIIKLLNLPIKIVGVLSDRDCNALEYAINNSLYAKKIEYSRTKNKTLKEELINLNPDIIITNFHKIIDSEIVEIFQTRLVNLHYSLLPSFSGYIGMKTLELAEKKNVKFIGTTAHLVDEIVDNGLILAQSCLGINWKEKQSIEDVIFKSGCLCLLNAILIKINISYTDFISVNLTNKNVFFSPSLRFDVTKIDEEFWHKIKLLS